MVQNSYLPHLMYIHANLLHFSKDHMLQCEHVWTLYIVRRGTKLKINQWLLKWLRLISLLGISCFKLFAMFPNSRTKHIDSLDMKDELNEIASLGFLFQHLNSFFKKHGYPNCLVLINRGIFFVSGLCSGQNEMPSIRSWTYAVCDGFFYFTYRKSKKNVRYKLV